MNKTLLLEAQIRERTGSKAAARARRQGQIPAIVYGHKQDPVAISLDAHDFIEGLHHGHRVLDVKVGGKAQKMMIKELQYDHLGRDIVHIDLMRVDVTETVRVSVPIELKGTAQGTHEGGIVEEHADHIEVECMVTNIPEVIVVSVKELDVGQAIHAGDVTLPDGVALVSAPETLLAACHVVAAAKSTEQLEEEAPAAPEVIGEKEPSGEGTEQ
ncbi:MAG: 50S ribosomal protein L25 [Sedimentisphaerales bacterium]|jgi:large subunit ribosomal protein L25|nr:50S ribosomal protein L25 [Planctomycetota bacterium]MDY0354900.1 50S ribosomal protein L25 [Sedimentisphaerales bacterium]NLT76927.1 50S ribosomal protein L25 [Planctomycetota bacterium]